MILERILVSSIGSCIENASLDAQPVATEFNDSSSGRIVQSRAQLFVEAPTLLDGVHGSQMMQDPIRLAHSAAPRINHSHSDPNSISADVDSRPLRALPT